MSTICDKSKPKHFYLSSYKQEEKAELYSKVSWVILSVPFSDFLLLPTGIKVIGGVKELTGEEFGVYVKRILPGGLASSDGKYCTFWW